MRDGIVTVAGYDLRSLAFNAVGDFTRGPCVTLQCFGNLFVSNALDGLDVVFVGLLQCGDERLGVNPLTAWGTGWISRLARFENHCKSIANWQMLAKAPTMP